MSVTTTADKHLEEAKEHLKNALDSVHQVIVTKDEHEYGSLFENDLYEIAIELNNIKRRL